MSKKAITNKTTKKTVAKRKKLIIKSMTKKIADKTKSAKTFDIFFANKDSFTKIKLIEHVKMINDAFAELNEGMYPNKDNYERTNETEIRNLISTN